MYYSPYICHHGVKGQKWGVRHEYKPIGRRKKSSTSKKSTSDRVKINSKKMNNTSEDDAEAIRKKASQDAMKKTLAVVGGVALTAAAAYAIKKHYDTTVDKTLKSGVELQRVLKEDTVDLNRAFYTSYKKGDNVKYRSSHPNTTKTDKEIAKMLIDMDNKRAQQGHGLWT